METPSGNRTRVTPFRFQSFIGETDPEEELMRAKAAERAKQEELLSPPPPPPTFSEQDILNAERSAYEKGLQAGYERAKAEFKEQQQVEFEQVKELLDLLAVKVEQSVQDQYDFLDRLQATVPPLALTMAKKVAGSALQDNPLLEIEAVVAQCIAELATDKELSIFVHPTLAPYLEGILAEQYFHNTGKSLSFHVKKDADLALYDCRVEWPSGAVHRNTEQLWAEMEKLIASFQVLFNPSSPQS